MQCLSSTCPSAPQTCLTAQKSLLLLKNNATDSKDKLTWKWIKGAATTLADLKDPTTTADYALCIYAGTADTLIAQLNVPPGSNWKALGTKGYKYNDPSRSQAGVQKIIVKSGAAGKSKALVKGKGTNLPDPTLPLSFPVTVQLFNYQSGVCLDSTFSSTNALKNTSTLFKAKQ
jgi:hypothetical protein